VIDPRSSKWIGYVDGASLLALSFTALVTPYEVAFVKACSTSELWYFNRLVDVIFVVDIILQFFLAYIRHDNEEGRVYESNHRKIVRHYLRGWFVPDLFTTSLSAIDFASDSCGTAEDALENCSLGSDSSDTTTVLAQIKVLRVIRVVRLVKLIRLLRASSLVAKWETRVSINYAAISLLRATLIVLFFLHWSACLWGLQVGFFGGGMESTWLGAGGYCVRVGDELPEIAYPNTPPSGATTSCDEQWVCRAAAPTYLGSLYTVSSVSAVIATPGNTVEQAVAIGLMLAGGTVWAQVTGIFCGVLSTMNPGGTTFRITLDNLNGFMHAKRFPRELQWVKGAQSSNPTPPIVVEATPPS